MEDVGPPFSSLSSGSWSATIDRPRALYHVRTFSSLSSGSWSATRLTPRYPFAALVLSVPYLAGVGLRPREVPAILHRENLSVPYLAGVGLRHRPSVSSLFAFSSLSVPYLAGVGLRPETNYGPEGW